MTSCTHATHGTANDPYRPITELREIHIDAQCVSGDLLSRLERLGYCDDHFVSAGNGMQRPPFHVTWRIEGDRATVRRRFREVWRSTVALVHDSADFVGYVEAEIIPSSCQVALPNVPYRGGVPFPLPVLKLVVSPRNKVADLHIKVPIANLTTDLEEMMASRGVFYVETPKGNRVYTLQFLSHVDAKAVFRAVTEYFRLAGAATEITYEICPAFYRRPHDLVVPGCVAGGFLTRGDASHGTSAAQRPRATTSSC